MSLFEKKNDSAVRPPEALEAIFREHHGNVFRTAYRITGNAADAEDVLQTVFMRLLRREEQPDLSNSAGSYLHRAAVNAALDMLRRRKRARAVDLDEVSDQLVDESNQPERRRGNRELSRRLREALTDSARGEDCAGVWTPEVDVLDPRLFWGSLYLKFSTSIRSSTDESLRL